MGKNIAIKHVHLKVAHIFVTSLGTLLGIYHHFQADCVDVRQENSLLFDFIIAQD
jgi:hypothetical protein